MGFFLYLCRMVKEFKAFIASEKLFGAKDKILLAVSGGTDSVVMCELFHRAGYAFGIAHCNFGLRGKESDGDETFVKKLSSKYKVTCHTKRFLTAKDAKEKKISIQMAARELRYKWFEEVRSKANYLAVATAHHLDDQAETFFINLIRNTGIAGLHGILPKQGHIVRPLLFTGRDSIAAFGRKHRLKYREDSSNAETKYLRNKIRHEILPVFREISPAFPQVLAETILRLRETEVVFRNSVEEIRKKIVQSDCDGIHINMAELKKLTPPGIFTFELLSPFGFSEPVMEDILRLPEQASGQVFLSPTHRLIRNREELLLVPLKDKSGSRLKEKSISIPETKKEIRRPVRLSFSKISAGKNFRIDTSKETATFDLHKIIFPLTLRHWRKGDFFYPFGMNKKKMLSDYFIDNKFSIPEKENAWLLCSGTQILWIVGKRPDHRFSVTSKTKEVLVVRWWKEKNS
jgi:tRNA(Ile)-lysidine synthase